MANDIWSREEHKASVEAYIEMWNLEKAGKSFTKKDYYTSLHNRFPHRTVKSFEFRMQNISHIFEQMGRSWITGLRPAKNVGSQASALIETLIAEVEGATPNRLAGSGMVATTATVIALPKGTKIPGSSSTSVTTYERDAEVKAWVLSSANGICECCGNPAPFCRDDGTTYLEVHHIRRLADGGTDTITNAVAVCPNCHRALHYSGQRSELARSLYSKISRLVRE